MCINMCMDAADGRAAHPVVTIHPTDAATCATDGTTNAINGIPHASDVATDATDAASYATDDTANGIDGIPHATDGNPCRRCCNPRRCGSPIVVVQPYVSLDANGIRN